MMTLVSSSFNGSRILFAEFVFLDKAFHDGGGDDVGPVHFVSGRNDIELINVVL